MQNHTIPPYQPHYSANPIRYPEQVNLLQNAVSGDRQATSLVLTYLSSSIEPLRRIMLASIHDWHHTSLLQHLLVCLALHRWESQDEINASSDCARLEDPTASQRIDRSITEVYIIDESKSEQRAKLTVLKLGIASPIPRIRYASASLMGLRNQPESLPFLTEAITYGDNRWKLMAIAALEVLDLEECCNPLILALADREPAIHQAARGAILDLGKKAIPGLIPALQHPDHHVRWHAAQALGMSGNGRAVHVLAESLVDEDDAVRWASANALANIDEESIPAILEVISNHIIDEPFRQAVFHALHAMKDETRNDLQPLIAALSGPTTCAAAPAVASRLLIEKRLKTTS